MRIRYFIFDGTSWFLQRAAQNRIEDAWEGRRPWDAAGGSRDLGIITVLLDDELRPQKGFHTRVEVTDGCIMQEAVWSAVRAWLQVKSTPLAPDDEACADLQPEVIYQRQGWPDPAEVYRQLAIALDVPIARVPSLSFGGPLLASCQLDVSVKQAHTYFA